MRDFPFWRSEISSAKTSHVLKKVGADLSQFQKQSGLFGDEEKKLTEEQVGTLRKMYKEKMKQLEKEALTPPAKPKFNK